MPRKRKVSIADEYEYRLHQRSGAETDRLPAAAGAGDRDALARCAGIAAAAIAKQPAGPDLAAIVDWAVDALWQIYAGAEPNAAFGWKRGKGRPPEFRALQRDFLIGHAIERLVTRDGMEPAAAAEVVARQYSRSPEHALTCYSNLRERRNKITISAL